MPTFEITLDGFGIDVPFDPRELWGRARVPVVVTINGFSYRSTIAHMTGRAMIPLRQSNREAAGVKDGDTVTVTVERDLEPRTVEVPEDLSEALGELQPVFDAMSFTQRREWVEGVLGAKRPETRARRVASAVEAVRTRR